MADDAKMYSQEEFDAMVQERDALKANRDQILTEAKQAKERLKNYDGVDPDEFKKLKDAAAEAERKKAESEGDFKSLEKQLIERHTSELGARDQRISTLTSALEKRLIDADAAQVLAELKGSVKGLLPHIRPHLKVVEQDGEFVAVVVDSRGNPRIADGKGTPMTIKDLAEEFRADSDLARLFEGSGSSGGGASKSNAGGGGASVVARGDNSAFIANLEGIASGKVEVR